MKTPKEYRDNLFKSHYHQANVSGLFIQRE